MDSQPTAEAAPPGPEDRTARNLRLLDELVDIGMDLTRDLRTQVAAQTEAFQVFVQGDFTNRTPPGGWITVDQSQRAFDRFTRAIRLTMVLQQRFEQDGEVRAAQTAKARSDETARARADNDKRNMDRQNEVAGAAFYAVEADLKDCEAAERFGEALTERLDDIEFADLWEQPPGVLLARILKDMGLKPDWAVFEDEPWAQAEIANPPPGSPYEGWCKVAGSSGDSLLNSHPIAEGDPSADEELSKLSPEPAHHPP